MFIPENLYEQIIRSMPIPCVDLFVINRSGRVLLLKRRNEPYKGEWWVAGGRVHVGETRSAAAKRKLFEECGLQGEPRELSTKDLILFDRHQSVLSHVIATIYRVDVDTDVVALDAQHDAAEWRLPSEWIDQGVHPYIRGILLSTVN